MRASIATAISIAIAGATSGCGCGDGNGQHGDGDTDGVPTGCVDRDDDGYGAGCEAGLDCDDWDPLHFEDCDDCAEGHAPGCECTEGDEFDCYEGTVGTEDVGSCTGGTRGCVDGNLGECEGQVLPAHLEECDNGEDDNCNGDVDEAWLCGDCVEPCHTMGVEEPSPDDPGSSGLVPNPDGPGVVLGQDEDEQGYAWIANSEEGTVSKLDIVTGAEVGRFGVGLEGTASDSPSRTAVDDYQNAYVANRAFDLQGSVTKIASNEAYCVDRDMDGDIDTATDSTPLALGEDECVLWTVPVGGVNALPRALVVDYGSIDFVGGYPWVGCFNEQRFYRLDPADGTVLDEVQLDVNTYGAAIDSEGWIWVSGRSSNAIQRFHYLSHVVEVAIPVPAEECGGGSDPYGITVDREDRVWVGVWDTGGSCRWDPEDEDWFFVETGGNSRGVAVDADNNIWASNDSAGLLYRFAADDGSDVESWAVPGTTPIGVGVDRWGKVWVIDYDSNEAARFDPLAETFDAFPVGTNPYTYSDFLGYQRWLMMPRGVWVSQYERCADSESDRWMGIEWETQTPSDSRIIIMGRSADSFAALPGAPEVTIAEIGIMDPDVGAKDLETVFTAAGVDTGALLEVTVYMIPGEIDVVSPVFESLQVFWFCSELT